ncbi:S8 family serine peptidase, partial [Vibrio astriarenae]
SYPAGYESVMMVGANDANDDIAVFSQFPPCTTVYTGKRGKDKEQIIDSTCVEVTAGGVNTFSAYPADMAVTSVLNADEQTVSSTGLDNSSQGYVSGDVHFMGIADAID